MRRWVWFGYHEERWGEVASSRERWNNENEKEKSEGDGKMSLV
jgi:hypothetical protein